MKRIYTYILGVVLLPLSGAVNAQTTGSYVPVYVQEQTQWCWAACSAMLYWAYGSGTQSQCTLVGVARDKENGNIFGGCNSLSNSTASPCTSPATFNSPQSIYGCDGSIESILDNYGISSTGYGYAFSATDVANATAARKHMVARWGWNSGGGHFVVINRYKDGNVYFNNPLSSSAYIWSYANFSTSYGSATWTHTLRMDNSAPYGTIYNKGQAPIDISAFAPGAEPSLNCYPNPASNRLNAVINLPEGQEGALSLCDATGRQVYSTSLGQGKHTLSIDVSSWARGIYFLQLNGTPLRQRVSIQ
ncbi:T9SS type A sorting domain-containing protein [Taibaiella koreensis]|uniref:T9SS type A sorting domain-containing protein n=1 Tax=Taibaiella koreensis TaxID=1268548 RepID=UPI000E5991FB|nr:T9SS type A sorting domain-containing protein [Taibaiella koreensis]